MSGRASEEMYEVKLILQTNEPLMKEDLALIGEILKYATDELGVDRHHLESYVTCQCGYEWTRVNPTKTMKQEWLCRNCGAVVIASNNKGE